MDEALREFDSLRIIREPRQLPLYGHNYAVNDPPNLASYLVYAEDLYVLRKKDEKPGTVGIEVKIALSKYNLIVNESLTEICVYANVKPKVDKLGILLDETAEINEQKQLTGFAFCFVQVQKFLEKSIY